MSVFDDIGDAFDSVKDAVSDAASSVPGSEWLGDNVKDFLNTGVGKTVAKALATNLTGGLAPILGPQLATVAFATPGILRGDRFDKAWIDEFADRAEKLAQYAGPAAAEQFASMLGPTIEKLKVDFPELDIASKLPLGAGAEMAKPLLAIPAWKLALPRNLREDLVALSLSALSRVPIPLDDFDPRTGKDKSVSDEARVKLLYPFASTFTQGIDKPSKVSQFLNTTSTQRLSQPSLVSQFLSPSPAAAPSLAPIANVDPPPLVKVNNPMMRDIPSAWYENLSTGVKIGAVAGALGLAFYFWRGRR